MPLSDSPIDAPQFDYLSCQRHILLDMHIPDWDERFLSRFDADKMVELYVAAGADAVMTYCNSHVGLCYWPTKVGKEHEGTRGADLVGETVRLLHERGIAACAYYSSIFNNWGYATNPSWRLVPLAADSFFGDGGRYGICCPNNPDYHAFQLAQVAELASSYPFDAFFFDMVFWPDVCGCEHCRDRFRKEAGAEFPERIDWFSKDWCRFQSAREHWLAERFGELVREVKRHRDIPAFFNAAVVPNGWQMGISHELLAHADLLGGDYQASHEGLYAYGHLLARLSPTVMQYMNAFSSYIGPTSFLKSVEEQLVCHALPATLLGGQYMAIDAIQPDGSTNEAAYERLADVFAAIEPFASSLGGQPLADAAVYWSLPSLADFRENGSPVSAHAIGLSSPKPHLDAIVGACSVLSSKLPVGVISRAELAELARYPVLVLPNLLRTDDEELDAIREYVASGGRLYASGYTSLVSVDGAKREDFGLADVFGCHYVGEETAALCYARPADDATRGAVEPFTHVPYGRDHRHGIHAPLPGTALRIRADASAAVRATVTLPYADGRGTRADQGWASIHGSPPWEDTNRPAIIEHAYGRGSVIYCAGDLEVGAASPGNEAARSLFIGLISSLLPAPPRFEILSDPGVWAAAFDDQQPRRMRLNLSNQPGLLPARPVPHLSFRLAPPRGRSFTSLQHRAEDGAVEYRIAASGDIEGEVRGLRHFIALEAQYE